MGKPVPSSRLRVCWPLRTREFGYFVFPFPWCLTGSEEGPQQSCIHGRRRPELAASRQEGELFPAGVLRHFLPKTKKNGLDLLEDGLDVPKDGVDTLVGGQIQWQEPKDGPSQSLTALVSGEEKQLGLPSHFFRAFGESWSGQSPPLHTCSPDPGFLELSCVTQTPSCSRCRVTAQT